MSNIVFEIEQSELSLSKKFYKATETIFNSNFSRIANRRVDKLVKKFQADSLSSKNSRLIIQTEQDPNKVIAWAVAQRVKSERMRRGLRQEDLAEKAGIKRPNIARLEKGFHMPSIPTLQKIAQALNLDMGSLMTPPTISAEDMHDFAEMAESGLSEWGYALEREDK
jgi:transcriptional regulator with XRE-family HTH domain